MRVDTPHYRCVSAPGPSSSAVSDAANLLCEGCEFTPGNLDVTVPQVDIAGPAGVALSDCLLSAQPSGSSMALFGTGAPAANRSTACCCTVVASP